MLCKQEVAGSSPAGSTKRMGMKLKQPKCRQIDYIVCARLEDKLTEWLPGSQVRACTKCGSKVSIAPSTLEMKVNAPIICFQCVLAMCEEELGS